MNSAVRDLVAAVSQSPALLLLVKANVALALGLCAVAGMRRSRAAARHAVLAATFAAVAALPVVSVVAPAVSVVARVGESAPSRSLLQAGRDVVMRGALPVPAAQRSWSVGDLLLVVWAIGAVVFLAPAIAGMWQVGRLKRSALPWRREGAIDLMLHEHLSGPVTCGRAILFPADATGWATEDVERAVVHEREHVARRDWSTHCAARIVCAVYWFDPLVWTAWRRLELEAERACDDAVVGRSDAAAYAEQLVALARRVSANASRPAMAMARRADLGSRVRAVLDERQRRGRAGVWRVATVMAAAMALAAGIGPLRVVAAPQETQVGGGPQFRAETQMVMTNVKVAYPNGDSIEGLTINDFVVTENEEPVKIQTFEYHGEVKPGYYVIGYYPRPVQAGEFRRLHIAVKSATTAIVTFRTGYYGATLATATPPSRAPALPPGATAPRLIFKRDPEYSDAARAAKYQGVVVLWVEISEDGRAENLKVQRSLGLGLDEKAVEAVKQWRWSPAHRDGKPVRVATQVDVSFRLL